MPDSIANFVVKIKWAILRNKQVVYVDYNKKNLFILELFLKEGCIRSFSICNNDIVKSKCKISIKVVLLYVENRSIIRDIELISKPSNRLYQSVTALCKSINSNIFQGFYVISTVNGLCLSNKLFLNHISDKTNHIAGEVLMRVVF